VDEFLLGMNMRHPLSRMFSLYLESTIRWYSLSFLLTYLLTYSFIQVQYNWDCRISRHGEKCVERSGSEPDKTRSTSHLSEEFQWLHAHLSVWAGSGHVCGRGGLQRSIEISESWVFQGTHSLTHSLTNLLTHLLTYFKVHYNKEYTERDLQVAMSLVERFSYIVILEGISWMAPMMMTSKLGWTITDTNDHRRGTHSPTHSLTHPLTRSLTHRQYQVWKCVRQRGPRRGSNKANPQIPGTQPAVVPARAGPGLLRLLYREEQWYE
jgi:hypothetical protein